jgi:hypothetical protein
MHPPKIHPARTKHNSLARARGRLLIAALLALSLFAARNIYAVLESSAQNFESRAPAPPRQQTRTPEPETSGRDPRRLEALLAQDAPAFQSKASLTMVGDWPACDYKTVCMSRTSFFLFTPVDDSGTRWNPEMNIMRNCFNGNYSGNLLSPEEFWRKRKAVTWLPGTTILVDTFLMRNQFGHVGLKLIQAYSLMRSLAPELVSYFVLLPLGQPLGASGTGQLARELFPDHVDDQRLLTFAELTKMGADSDVVCMERALRLGRMFERQFAGPADLERWEAMLSHKPSLLPRPHAQCPVPRAVVLQRRPDPTAHHAIKLRSWTNYGEIEQALRRQGVCTYENISVDGTMNISSQAQLFSQFALVFAVHSSQLVNLAFAHPLSAALEIRVDPGFGKHPNPRNFKKEPYREDPFSIWPSSFCSWHMCPGLFNVSVLHGHNRDWRGASDYDLNIPVFEQDLKLLLDRQRERARAAGCAPIFKPPGGCT